MTSPQYRSRYAQSVTDVVFVDVMFLCGAQRVALETIAFSMNAAQIQAMRKAFVKMDKVCESV